MKISRKWVLVAALVLSVAMATSGTLAYLQDTAEDVNVMTLGSVHIENREYERVKNADGTYKTDTIDDQTSYVLKEFSQNKPLLPYVGEVDNGYDPIPVRLSQVGHGMRGGMSVLPAANVQDKFIFVENTGKSDAYVRTIVAFEAGDVAYDDWYKLINYSFHMTWEEKWMPSLIDVNGNNFYVVEFTYKGYQDSQTQKHPNGVLTPGEYTYNSLAQVYMFDTATNEDVEKLDGNKNGKFDILVLSQAVQADGFSDAKTALDTAFGETEKKAQDWFSGVKQPATVNTLAELQAAVDAAEGKTTIIVGDAIAGDLTVTQKPGVEITIDGTNNSFDGVIIVDGKSARYADAALTIKNINFNSANPSADAYINLGKKGDNNTRYTNNVTVSGCDFDTTATGDVVAVKSYTGGDKNLTIENCTVSEKLHSMVQVTNVEEGLTITGCTVESKNGINLNNTPSLEMSGCNFDTKGYAIRFGVNGSTLNGNFNVVNSTLKSANDDGDAVIIFRGAAEGSTLTLENTTLTGTPDITGTANVVKK